jgi:hypothetical protein
MIEDTVVGAEATLERQESQTAWRHGGLHSRSIIGQSHARWWEYMRVKEAPDALGHRRRRLGLRSRRIRILLAIP